MLNIEITDPHLETLKAQEQQAREDLLANPDVEFFQKELTSAREAVRAYLGGVQESSAALRQQLHERTMALDQQIHQRTMQTNDLMHRDNIVHAQERVIRDQIAYSAGTQSWAVTANHLNHVLSLAAMTQNANATYQASPAHQVYPTQPVIQMALPSLPAAPVRLQ